MSNPPGRPKIFKKRSIIQIPIEETVKVELERIGKREGKQLAEIYREITQPIVEVYIKNHKSGNSQFTLDKPWDDLGMIALPTIGEPLKREKVDSMDDETLVEIATKSKARMEEAIAGLRRRDYKLLDLDRLRSGGRFR